MFHVELTSLGGILGPLKSDLGLFWLYFGSFFAWFYNVKTQTNAFSQKAPNRIGWFLVYALLFMSSITVPNPANGCFLSRCSRLRTGWAVDMELLSLEVLGIVGLRSCWYWIHSSTTAADFKHSKKKIAPSIFRYGKYIHIYPVKLCSLTKKFRENE